MRKNQQTEQPAPAQTVYCNSGTQSEITFQALIAEWSTLRAKITWHSSSSPRIPYKEACKPRTG
jgi:hypothetical protein